MVTRLAAEAAGCLWPDETEAVACRSCRAIRGALRELVAEAAAVVRAENPRRLVGSGDSSANHHFGAHIEEIALKIEALGR